jgi:hypothetical protein
MNQALQYALAAAFVAGGVALVAVAQTPPPNPASTSAPPVAAPTTAPVPAKPAAVPAAAPVASPERFEPTDKVRADFDVSFPIDI